VAWLDKHPRFHLQQAVCLVWYCEVGNPLVSLWGRRTPDRLLHEGGEV
jgi:hypothetical protein